MRLRLVTVMAVLALGVFGSTAIAGLKEGVKLEAGGKAINVDIGHAVPVALDWNSDGKKDLLVGQFSGGKIRLYLNHGIDSAPQFKDFTYLRAGGQEISLPAG